MLRSIEIESAVRAEIARLLQEQDKPPAQISADDALSETLALTSLDVVELIVALTARLGVDPFRQRAFTEMRTVADLVQAYAGAPAPGERDVELAASRRRAEARREGWGTQA